jgi:hypothetical protein
MIEFLVEVQVEVEVEVCAELRLAGNRSQMKKGFEVGAVKWSASASLLQGARPGDEQERSITVDVVVAAMVRGRWLLLLLVVVVPQSAVPPPSCPR